MAGGLPRIEGKYKAAEGMVSWKEKVFGSFSVWERESPRNLFREMKMIRSSRLSHIQARDLGYREKKKKKERQVKEVAENSNVPSETKVRSLLNVTECIDAQVHS